MNDQNNKVKAPFTDIQINTTDTGFYEGYSIPIALISKIGVVLLVIWALVWSDNAATILSALNANILYYFNSFYTIATGAFLFFILAIAIIPSTGNRRLGRDDEKPEFSTFSWFSMLFGAGLGVGLMVFATAEPLGLWGSNPILVQGLAKANTEGALPSAYEYAFLHYGFHAWSIYLVTGISIGYYAYRRGVPLTIRSTLSPIFGKYINGSLGHFVDILAVLATVLGIAVTIGFGVSQFVDGISAILPMDWLMSAGSDGKLSPSKTGLMVALIILMGLSILSAASGVGRGVKYLSNLNLVLSAILLLSFLIFGAFVFSMKMYGIGMLEYIKHIFQTSFVAYDTNTALGKWQSGWTTFYWAWWISWSPFVGMFIARISRGRTIRSIVLGAMVAPALIVFLWLTALGGTSINLELTNIANGAIIGANNSAKLFTTMSFMFHGPWLYAITAMAVVLILTFLVTSADSGILVLNTIMSGGNVDTGIKHRIIWGVIITAVIAALLVVGNNAGGNAGMNTLKSAMIIGALPFAILMALMCISLTKALIFDHKRDKYGTTE
ncbi:MAG: BCCT family transporter [Ostreibacterium sp.]